jgi:hypothetical protein
MDLKDVKNVDPAYDEVVVQFNAHPETGTFSVSAFAAKDFGLQSIQKSSADTIVHDSKYDSARGEFTVPGRTTAVFVISSEQAPQPTPVAEEIPASTSSNNRRILAGLIALALATIGTFFYWRGGHNP